MVDELQELIGVLTNKHIKGVTLEEDEQGHITAINIAAYDLGLTTGEEIHISGARGDGAIDWMITPIPPTMRPIDPERGHHMTLAAFIEDCKSGFFIDYDGGGHYATKTEESDIGVHPSDVMNDEIELRSDYTHVVWYNR